MTMFKGCKVIVPAEGEDEIIDHDVVIDYLREIGDAVPAEYEDPYGQGRFVIITEENKDLLAEEEAVTEAVTEAVEETATEEAVEEVTEAAEEVLTEAAEEVLTEAVEEATTEAVTE